MANYKSISNGNAQIPGRRESSIPGRTWCAICEAEIFEIVQKLPESDGECQYKIKSDEPHLRVAKEHQLRRV
jgi:hypothetical protein